MWKEISEKYEASDNGHIRNKRTKKILKEFIGKDGYLRTQFDGKTRTIHRVIATAFIPRDPSRDFVNHIDGNKKNNCVDNLEWCTRSENLCHAYNTGLKSRPIGSKNPRCKLSDEQVTFIKKHYIKGDREYGAIALSKRFGVAHQTICAVVSGQNWDKFE